MLKHHHSGAYFTVQLSLLKRELFSLDLERGLCPVEWHRQRDRCGARHVAVLERHGEVGVQLTHTQRAHCSGRSIQPVADQVPAAMPWRERRALRARSTRCPTRRAGDRFQRATVARWYFFNEQAALKCLDMVVRSFDPKGTGQERWVNAGNPPSTRSPSPSKAVSQRSAHRHPQVSMVHRVRPAGSMM